MPVVTGNVVAIKKIDEGVYAVDIADASGVVRAYEFRCLADSRVPMVVWSEAFDSEVGTLGTPDNLVAPVVLAFHRLAQLQFRISLESSGDGGTGS